MLSNITLKGEITKALSEAKQALSRTGPKLSRTNHFRIEPKFPKAAKKIEIFDLYQMPNGPLLGNRWIG